MSYEKKLIQFPLFIQTTRDQLDYSTDMTKTRMTNRKRITNTAFYVMQQNNQV